MRLPFAIVALLLALLIFAGQVDATDISACSNLNSAGTTYNLTSSITNSNAFGCMNITANSIILDCGGFTIDGSQTGNQYGINATGRTNITIRNCIITDWTQNIRFNNVNDSIIENTNVTRMSGAWGTANAIRLQNSDNNTLRNVSITPTGDIGILLTASSRNVLANITIMSNNTNSLTDADGIQMVNSHYNIINSSVIKRTAVGIAFRTTGSNYTYIHNNTLDNNSYSMIDDASGTSSHNIITNNNILRNRLWVNYGPNNTYSYNVFYGAPYVVEMIRHNADTSQVGNISHNIFYGGGADRAMDIMGGKYNIEFNIISNVSYGVVITSQHGSSNISSNIIENGTVPSLGGLGTISYGIGILSVGDLQTIHNNSVKNVYTAIEVRQASDNVTISNNTIYNMTNGMVFVGEPGSDSPPPNPTSGPQNLTIIYNNITYASSGIVFGATLSGPQVNQNKTNSAFSRITSNNISNTNTGVKLVSAPNNTIFDNTFASNNLAIKLTSSPNNTLENNTFISNGNGVEFDPSPNNTLTGNLFKRNGVDVLDDSFNVYTNNIFYLPDNSTFLRFNGNAIGYLYSAFSFNLSTIYPNGSSAIYALNSVSLYPSRTFAYTNTSNDFTGNFTVTDGGISSLVFNMTIGSNTIYVSYPMFMGGNIQESKTYYLNNSEPTRGQPKGLDLNNSILGKSLRLDTPAGEFISENTTKHIFSVEDSPLTVSNVNIERINMSVVYSSTGSQRVILGIENNIGADNSTILNTTFPGSSVYVSNSSSFAVNWTMDSPNKWFRMGGKIIGNNITWKTNSTIASHLNLTYKYAASAPKVFNITSGAKI